MQEVLPLLVFQTDFTYKEGAIASMYGVVRSVSREVEIITATHDLPQYDIWSASYRLMQYVRFWPKGTVFVSVVDPGVGTSRRACVAKTMDGYYIVTPDNGTLTHVWHSHGIAQVRQIDETVNRLKSTEGTSVFHGRDLFGYCGARLAAGIISYEEVGPVYDPESIVRLPISAAHVENGRAEGIIEIDDPNFGNAWTNIPVTEMLENGFAYGDDVQILLKKGEEILLDQAVRFDRTFGDVAKGDVILYNNELMNVALAVSQGSFIEQYHCGFGSEYTIVIRKTEL